MWEPRSVFAEGSNGHGQVVQLAAFPGRKRGNFPVGVEAGEYGPFAEKIAYAFHFLFDPLLEDQLAADATDENGVPVRRARARRPRDR